MHQNSGEEKKPVEIPPPGWPSGWAFTPQQHGPTPGAIRPQASESASNATKPPSPGQGHPEYLKVVEERKALHIEKSSGYGTGKDPFANFTAVAELTGMPRWVYPMLRAEEKLQRCWSLYTQGRHSELEEEFTDISSLFDCATAMLREDQDATDELSYK